MQRRLTLTAALLLGLGYATSALAEERPDAARGTLSLIYENDTFAATDRNYTNGIDVSYLSAPNAAPLPARWLAKTVLRAKDKDVIYAGIGLGQSIFTPSNTETTVALPTQHPYAGWLHLALSTVVDSGTTLDTLALITRASIGNGGAPRKKSC